MEPLISENANRYSLFPIQYPDIWSMYQMHLRAFWNPSEIVLSEDRKDWEGLNSNEQHFIKWVLGFFVSADGIVLENLVGRFFKEIQIPEVRSFYSFQIAIETIHAETYARLIDFYVEDDTEKFKLMNANQTIPVIKDKAQWAMKWIASDKSFAHRLAAFSCVEGIFFSGSFCCLFWLKQRGLLHGLTHSNELIARDEGLHTDFAILLYTKYIQHRLSDDDLHAMVREAVDIETRFIIDAIPCKLLGINSDMMVEYIQYVANVHVKRMGHTPLFPNVKQPFAFMERICFSQKTNFFEREVSQYQQDVEPQKKEIDFSADF